jgi:hypothetical protein
MARRPLVLVLVCITLGGGWPPGARGAVTVSTPIGVRVYNAGVLDPTAVPRALALAGATLSAAAVDVVWQQCGDRVSCHAPMRPAELSLRLVRAAHEPHVRGAMPLGDALIEPLARTGVLATIYVDRVEFLAADSGIDAATLLGRAIAHELGHLLLATTAHSTRGLMRAKWSRAEIRRREEADWSFSGPDVAAIRARLRGLLR